MNRATLILFVALAALNAIAGPLPIDPPTGRTFTSVKTPKLASLLTTQSVLPPPPATITLNIALTGSGAEWITLPFATNYLFAALTSTNPALPLAQWTISYPALTNGTFTVTGPVPLFCSGMFQPKTLAQPASGNGILPINLKSKF